jgi:predicted ATPase
MTLIEHAEKVGHHPARTFGTYFRGWVLMTRGEVERGYALLRPALGSSQEGSTVLRCAHVALAGVYFYGGLTSMAPRTDIIEDAQPLISDVLSRFPDDDARWSTAELLRLKGEFMLLTGAAQASEMAERHFMESLSIARKAGARSWELRTAISLARLWSAENRAEEARALLFEVYKMFDEGFYTADLCTARMLLEKMDSVGH